LNWFKEAIRLLIEAPNVPPSGQEIGINTTLRAMPEPTTTTDLHDAAMAALRQVDDPEMGENLVDLGVIGGIEVSADAVHITLIPTSATCPMADVMLDDAEAAVQAICPAGFTAQAEMDWDTPWSPERLSPALRERFGW
jgi:metal-sulfur cluster biosynthetic enzyme